MRRSTIPATLLLAGLCFGWLVSPANGEPSRRSIVVASAGPQQLDVDLELLTGADSTLADLRLLDGTDQEVPYLLVQPPTGAPHWERAQQLQPAVAKAGQSGFEADLGELRYLDRVRFLGLPSPFMKRLRLQGSGNRQAYVELLPEATLFDLPDSGLRRVELDVPPGNYRYLRVLFDDRATSPVPRPTGLEVRLVTADAPRRPLVAPVRFEERPGRPELSRWRVLLPRKHLPIRALELDTDQPKVLRLARVSESRLGSAGLQAVALGQSMLRRASNTGMVAADLRIPISPPETTELSLVVDNGNNPPLALGEVFIELEPQPFIYFEASEAGTFQATYGSPKLTAPSYDLEVDREKLLEHPRNLAKWAGNAARIAEAPPSPLSATPPESITHGPVIDTRPFLYSRPVLGQGGRMASLPLDAAVLAHSRDLSDLRLVDSLGRQVPYLLEQDSEPSVVEVALRAAAPSEHSLAVPRGASVYRVALPYPRLPEARLALTTSSRVFRREVSLYAPLAPRPRKPPSYQQLTAGTWEHVDSAAAASSLELALSAEVGDTLFVIVDNGDNTPLTPTKTQLLLPSRSLRYFHTRGETLTLFYGLPSLGAPRYDMALLAAELSQIPSTEETLGPEHQKVEVTHQKPGMAKWFMALLGGTVLLLLLFIVRLVKKSDATDAPADSTNPSKSPPRPGA